MIYSSKITLQSILASKKTPWILNWVSIEKQMYYHLCTAVEIKLMFFKALWCFNLNTSSKMFMWSLSGWRSESGHACHHKVSTRQQRNEPLRTSSHFFFFYETISIYKNRFQETKALFGVNESEEYETLQDCAPSHGNLTKVK